jgi:esterase/lipase
MEECMGNAYEDCKEVAVYIRHTQFAGSHPLCEKHAKEDETFLCTNSYQDWEKIS